jgi:hypothetical protein
MRPQMHRLFLELFDLAESLLPTVDIPPESRRVTSNCNVAGNRTHLRDFITAVLPICIEFAPTIESKPTLFLFQSLNAMCGRSFDQFTFNWSI